MTLPPAVWQILVLHVFCSQSCNRDYAAVAAEADCDEADAPTVSTCAFSSTLITFLIPGWWHKMGCFPVTGRTVCTKIARLMNEAHTISCLELHYNCLFRTGTRLCLTGQPSVIYVSVCGCVCVRATVSSTELVVLSRLCKYYSLPKCSATQANKGMNTSVKVWVWGGRKLKVMPVFHTLAQPIL